MYIYKLRSVVFKIRAYVSYVQYIAQSRQAAGWRSTSPGPVMDAPCFGDLQGLCFDFFGSMDTLSVFLGPWMKKRK